MPLYCDNCGGPRINGSPITRKDGTDVLAHGGTPHAEIVGYWCRECIRENDITLYP